MKGIEVTEDSLKEKEKEKKKKNKKEQESRGVGSM
jgi:hypothetical protein